MLRTDSLYCPGFRALGCLGCGISGIWEEEEENCKFLQLELARYRILSLQFWASFFLHQGKVKNYSSWSLPLALWLFNCSVSNSDLKIMVVSILAYQWALDFTILYPFFAWNTVPVVLSGISTTTVVGGKTVIELNNVCCQGLSQGRFMDKC